jgi:hypothetical protein
MIKNCPKCGGDALLCDDEPSGFTGDWDADRPKNIGSRVKNVSYDHQIFILLNWQ